MIHLYAHRWGRCRTPIVASRQLFLFGMSAARSAEARLRRADGSWEQPGACSPVQPVLCPDCGMRVMPFPSNLRLLKVLAE